MFVPSKPNKGKNKPTIVAAQTGGPNTLKTFQRLPSHEQICQRAYAIYQSGGCVNGRDQQDWFRAEIEMFSERKL
jgi:hypothetical protein